MERDAAWVSVDGRSIEHVHLSLDAAGFTADGLIVRKGEHPSSSSRYRIEGDPSWRLRRAIVHRCQSPDRRLEFVTDGRGQWWNRSGAPAQAVEGCLDLDIEDSPFTNTLAIRRLNLAPGQSREIRAAFVKIPDLDASRSMQRYSRILNRTDPDLYRYEGLESGFTAELPVDSDGLLLEYPGYFVRLPDPLDRKGLC